MAVSCASARLRYLLTQGKAACSERAYYLHKGACGNSSSQRSFRATLTRPAKRTDPRTRQVQMATGIHQPQPLITWCYAPGPTSCKRRARCGETPGKEAGAYKDLGANQAASLEVCKDSHPQSRHTTAPPETRHCPLFSPSAVSPSVARDVSAHWKNLLQPPRPSMEAYSWTQANPAEEHKGLTCVWGQAQRPRSSREKGITPRSASGAFPWCLGLPPLLCWRQRNPICLLHVLCSWKHTLSPNHNTRSAWQRGSGVNDVKSKVAEASRWRPLLYPYPSDNYLCKVQSMHWLSKAL